MKHKICIALLFISFLLLSGISASHASMATTKTQILEMQSGEKLLNKIDNIAIRIANKSKQDADFRTRVTDKIEIIKDKYSRKTDTRSKKIVIIFSYLGDKISSELGIASSRILERFQRIEAETYKTKAVSRTNQLKVKNYQRVQIKK